MHQSTRSLRPVRILRMLRSGDRFSLAALAESFDVSERTAQRDLLLLRKAGVFVDFDPQTRTYGIAELSDERSEDVRSEAARLLASAARSSILYAAPPQRGAIESAISLLLGDVSIDTESSRCSDGSAAGSVPVPRSEVVEALRLATSGRHALRARIEDPRTGWEWRLTLVPLWVVQDRGRPALLARSLHQDSLFLVDLATVLTAEVDEEIRGDDRSLSDCDERIQRLF